ncbi:MAG TPA: hypothetical protein VFV50_15420 [Bdellovibrionales bacterium]|nr:hypothetical protein [Bdellovibrionales bacterium]
MKQIIVLAALLAVSATAQATRPEAFTKTSQVTSVELDRKIGPERVVSGRIQYNLVTKKLKIELRKAGTCGFASCDNLKMKIELPITVMSDKGCGLRVVAESPHAAVGGTRQKVDLIDYSNKRCKIAVPLDETVKIVYTTEFRGGNAGETVSTSSKIYGGPTN